MNQKEDFSDLKEKNLLQKIEKLRKRKKVEKYLKLKNIKNKRKEELLEDNKLILTENKRKRSKMVNMKETEISKNIEIILFNFFREFLL